MSDFFEMLLRAKYDRMYTQTQVRSSVLLGDLLAVPALILQGSDSLGIAQYSIQLPLFCSACGKGIHLNKRRLERLDQDLTGTFLLHITHIDPHLYTGESCLQLDAVPVHMAFKKYGYDLGWRVKGERSPLDYSSLGLIFGPEDLIIDTDRITEQDASRMIFLIVHPNSLLSADLEPETEDSFDMDERESEADADLIHSALLQMLDDQNLCATENPSQSIFRGNSLHVLCKSSEILSSNMLQTFCALSADCVAHLNQSIHFDSPPINVPGLYPGHPIYGLDLILRGIRVCNGSRIWMLALDVLEQSGSQPSMDDDAIRSRLKTLILERTGGDIHVEISITRRIVDKSASDYDPFRMSYYDESRSLLNWVRL